MKNALMLVVQSIFLMLLALAAVMEDAIAEETPEQKEARMQWFEDAKLGIFIHWGIYAVDGIDESWSFYNGYISHQDYMKQLDGFTASKYAPEVWAELIKKSGAKYAVLTSKHHDGVALWDTKQNDLSVVKKTPAGRDLIDPYCKALRKRGLKVGLYYSHLDWSSPDYPHWTKTTKRYKDDPERWQRFLAFRKHQVEEICTLYKPDLIWFDGDWDYDAEKWQSAELRRFIFDMLPGTIINSRLNGHGDYATPEQSLPMHSPDARWWELCMTMNDSWGFQHNDLNYKTPNQVIRLLADCISLGGNLLLDIGPKADGTIPDEQVKILEELGRWTRKHAEAIYGTRAGLPPGYFYGPSAFSKDRQTLFLFVPHRPRGPVVLKGIKNAINRIWVVGNGTKLNWKVMMKPYWSSHAGLTYIDVPEDVLDDQVTVLAVLLKGEAQF